MRNRLTINIDDDLISAIKIQAIKEKRSVSEIIKILLTKYLDGEIKIEDK